MAYTQADLDALKAAIASGARKVIFGSGPDSRTVEYRSLNDMLATLSLIAAEVSPGTAPSSRTVGSYSSGLAEPYIFYDRCWDRR
jgi:hypothetical protein